MKSPVYLSMYTQNGKKFWTVFFGYIQLCPVTTKEKAIAVLKQYVSNGFVDLYNGNTGEVKAYKINELPD